jgi:hypothetical protein
MKPSLQKQVDALHDMTVAELREKYAEVFREESRSRHKDFLRKRIAWRLQANEEGGLSERARRRAQELANDADLRLLAPVARTVSGHLPRSHDRRLPMPGTVLTREYKGRKIAVTVLDGGFEHAGTVYRSLTAVAKVVTGSHWNGMLFFGLTGKETKR